MPEKIKNILLVYPEIPDDTYWSLSNSLEFIGKRSSTPPLGLLTVAAMMPEKYELRLVDMNIQHLTDEDLGWADALFTSSMICQKDSLEDLVRRAKPFGMPIVAGGPYPTQYYDEPDMNGIDHFIIGEAESGVLNSFLSDLESGKPKRAYARHVIRKGTGSRKIGHEIDSAEWENLRSFFGEEADIQLAECRPSMDVSPIPRFDLLDIEAYGTMAIQLSRGCPHNCEFCNEPTLFGHSPRFKTAEKTVDEMQVLYDLDYRGPIFVVDDNFIGNKVKVKEVLKEIRNFQENKGYPFSLYTETDITLSLDEELLGLMRGAGFNMVFIGLESPSKEVLRDMGKSHNVSIELVPAVKKIQRYGMEVTGGFIVGNDSDPPDICDKIFDFCEETGIVMAMVGMLTAVKGSALYERLKKEGRLLGDTEGNNTHSFETNFTVKDPKIVHDYKILMERLYDRSGKNYFSRARTLLKNLGWSPKSSREVGAKEIMAIKKSFWSHLIKGSCRYDYARFLGYTALTKPRMLPEAVTKAVYFTHFRKVTANALARDSFYNPENLYAHLEKEVDLFKEKAANIWQQGIERGENLYHVMTEEKNSFLKSMKQKMEVLPRDYRTRLMQTSKRTLSNYINNLRKTNPNC